MNELQNAYYCVMQIVPDPGRAEAANVGVLVFVPDHQSSEKGRSITDFDWDQQLSRVQKFFAGEVDIEAVRAEIVANVNKITMVRDSWSMAGDVAEFIRHRLCNRFKLTYPRSMAVPRPATVRAVSEALKALMEDLVHTPDNTFP